MNKSHYTTMATFNEWANKKVAAFISENINEAMAEKEIISSFSSVKKTVYHLWDAESIWLERLQGNSPKEFISLRFNGSFENGLANFLSTSNKLLSFLIDKDEAYFSGDVSYHHTSGKFYSHRVHDVLTHVVNHSTFHRGQLITMFRQLGFVKGIPQTDFIEYCREKALSKSEVIR